MRTEEDEVRGASQKSYSGEREKCDVNSAEMRAGKEFRLSLKLECCYRSAGNGNPHQYSCLENPMDRGAGQATVHGVARVGHNLATKLPPPPISRGYLHNADSLSCSSRFPGDTDAGLGTTLLPREVLDPIAAAAKSLQSYPTLCDPTDGSPPGPVIPGILQARTLEWVAISFSNA